MLFKEYWYDWGKYNRLVFDKIYGQGVEKFHGLLPYFDFIGNYEHFHYLLLFVTAMFMLKLAARVATGRSTGGYVFRSYGAWLCALVVGFLAMAGIITTMKGFFGFPRPYYELSHVTMLYGTISPGGEFRSFPSGHVAFTAFWATLLWSQVWDILKPLLIAVVIGMCWFRIAIGVHYPMDVLTSICISMFVAGFFRTNFRKLFKVWK